MLYTCRRHLHRHHPLIYPRLHVIPPAPPRMYPLHLKVGQKREEEEKRAILCLGFLLHTLPPLLHTLPPTRVKTVAKAQEDVDGILLHLNRLQRAALRAHHRLRTQMRPTSLQRHLVDTNVPLHPVPLPPHRNSAPFSFLLLLSLFLDSFFALHLHGRLCSGVLECIIWR